MDISKATPRPWKYDATPGDWAFMVDCEIERGEPIILCGDDDALAPSPVNAALIVRAVNSFDAMREALDECEFLLDDLADGAPDNPVGRRAGVALDQVRAALALAEKGTA